MHREGAEIAYTYQNERLQSRVEKCALQTNSKIVLPCDVANDSRSTRSSTALPYWDSLVLSSTPWAMPRKLLAGNYLDTVRDGFRIARHQFLQLCRSGQGWSPTHEGPQRRLLTLTYIGAGVRYSGMGLAKASLEANGRDLAQALSHEGIRVNGISAGPIRTLAASGINDFKKLLDYNDLMAPLGRGVTIEEVGNVGAFLCSDLASGVTGEITYVDCGFNTVAIGLNYQQLLTKGQ